MKKLSLYIFLVLMWCNVGVADILLKNCVYFEPAGSKNLDGSIMKEEKVYKLDKGERNEYYVSFEDGAVYSVHVKPNAWVDALESLDVEEIKKVSNNKFIITFADEKLITAIGKIGDDGPFYVVAELEINLENNEIRSRHFGETDEGKKLVKMMEKMGTKVNFERCEGAGIKDPNKGASGTAFFISNQGYLLTNDHVVEGCKSQKINYYNKEYDAELVSTDKTLDLALLKANVRPKSFISFSRDEPKKRQVITAAGYPLGKYLSDDLKINDGRISALKGFENNTNQLQHDIAINPGNSGGPIVNENGQLVAIAVSGMSKDVTEGLNFGIKASAVASFLKSNKISPSKGYMNFSMSDDKLVELLEESTVYTFCN